MSTVPVNLNSTLVSLNSSQVSLNSTPVRLSIVSLGGSRLLALMCHETCETCEPFQLAYTRLRLALWLTLKALWLPNGTLSYLWLALYWD